MPTRISIQTISLPCSAIFSASVSLRARRDHDGQYPTTLKKVTIDADPVMRQMSMLRQVHNEIRLHTCLLLRLFGVVTGNRWISLSLYAA